jgi:hypothetical protein
MFNLPTYAWPFIFALLAAGAAWFLGGRKLSDSPGMMPIWILYMVAAACVVIGFATLWLSHNA